VRARGKAVVLRGLIAREIFGMGVIILGSTGGITTKEHFGEGEEALSLDSFEAKRGRLDVVLSDVHMEERWKESRKIV
jgi:hypothetical protein